MTTAIAACCMFGFVTISAFVIEVHFNLTPVEFSYCLLSIGLTGLIITNTTRYVLKHISINQMQQMGLVLILISSLGLIFISSNQHYKLSSILGLVWLMTAGQMYVLISSFPIATKNIQAMKGTLSGIYNSMQILLSFVFSLIISHWNNQHSLIYFAISIFGASIVGLIITNLLKNKLQ